MSFTVQSPDAEHCWTPGSASRCCSWKWSTDKEFLQYKWPSVEDQGTTVNPLWPLQNLLFSWWHYTVTITLLHIYIITVLIQTLSSSFQTYGECFADQTTKKTHEFQSLDDLKEVSVKFIVPKIDCLFTTTGISWLMNLNVVSSTRCVWRKKTRLRPWSESSVSSSWRPCWKWMRRRGSPPRKSSLIHSSQKTTQSKRVCVRWMLVLQVVLC